MWLAHSISEPEHVSACMARTYGEILDTSFGAVFELAAGEDTAFVDIGSGHGNITIEAVRSYGCSLGLGIEKYREPADICRERLASLPAAVKQKLRFIFEDISDVDLGKELTAVSHKRVLLFCNNLAFSQGTLGRLARKVDALMRRPGGGEVVMVSTVPLPPLQAHFERFIYLRMSWTHLLHESCVYRYCPP